MALWAADSTHVVTATHTFASQAITRLRVTGGHRFCLGAHGREAHDIRAEDTVFSTKLSRGPGDDSFNLEIWVHTIRAAMTFRWLNAESSRAFQGLALEIPTGIFGKC